MQFTIFLKKLFFIFELFSNQKCVFLPIELLMPIVISKNIDDKLLKISQISEHIVLVKLGVVHEVDII